MKLTLVDRVEYPNTGKNLNFQLESEVNSYQTEHNSFYSAEEKSPSPSDWPPCSEEVKQWTVLLSIMLVTDVTKHTKLNREVWKETLPHKHEICQLSTTTKQTEGLGSCHTAPQGVGAGYEGKGTYTMETCPGTLCTAPLRCAHPPASSTRKLQGHQSDLSFSSLEVPLPAHRAAAGHCSLAPSVASDEHLSGFFDFLCSCSCSFLRSFSLCFSIFS